jgi:hypothetical protein
MKTITFQGLKGIQLGTTFENSTFQLMKAISEAPKPDSVQDPDEWNDRVVEAILRTNDMFGYLARWRVINGELIDERAAAAAQKAALYAIGLVGVGVTYTVAVGAAPALAATAAWTGALRLTPIAVELISKASEVAVGSSLGFFGAPGAYVAKSTFGAATTADLHSENNHTLLSCELSAQIEQWKKEAPRKLLSSALKGAALGSVAGTLKFTEWTSRLVTPYIVTATSLESVKLVGKFKAAEVEALALYRLAEAAEQANDHPKAMELLKKSREISHQAEAFELEALLFATLSVGETKHFRKAFFAGWRSISRLAANRSLAAGSE